MPRRKNPVTEAPAQTEDFPIQHEPGSHGGIFDNIPEHKSNVVQLHRDNSPAQTDRDWSEIDSILSDVVNFGA